jgi:sulfate permease, SulP family
MTVPNLGCVRILADMSNVQRSAFSEYGEVLELASGQDVLKQGKAADALYLLLDGKVGIYVTGPEGSEVHLRTIETGGHFGEVGLLQSGTRTANVRTLTRTMVFRLDAAAFKRVLKDAEVAVPLLHGLSRSLAIRLADITNRLADARSLKDAWSL